VQSISTSFSSSMSIPFPFPSANRPCRGHSQGSERASEGVPGLSRLTLCKHSFISLLSTLLMTAATFLLVQASLWIPRLSANFAISTSFLSQIAASEVRFDVDFPCVLYLDMIDGTCMKTKCLKGGRGALEVCRLVVGLRLLPPTSC
jgi:hypothetical protein